MRIQPGNSVERDFRLSWGSKAYDDSLRFRDGHYKPDQVAFKEFAPIWDSAEFGLKAQGTTGGKVAVGAAALLVGIGTAAFVFQAANLGVAGLAGAAAGGLAIGVAAKAYQAHAKNRLENFLDGKGVDLSLEAARKTAQEHRSDF